MALLFTLLTFCPPGPALREGKRELRERNLDAGTDDEVPVVFRIAWFGIHRERGRTQNGDSSGFWRAIDGRPNSFVTFRAGLGENGGATASQCAARFARIWYAIRQRGAGAVNPRREKSHGGSATRAGVGDESRQAAICAGRGNRRNRRRVRQFECDNVRIPESG